MQAHSLSLILQHEGKVRGGLPKSTSGSFSRRGSDGYLAVASAWYAAGSGVAARAA